MQVLSRTEKKYVNKLQICICSIVTSSLVCGIIQMNLFL